VYFITQNPRDIPDVVLAQLQNKIQHALHAYTPAEQKAVRAAAQSFRENPAFSTFDAIQELGTGQAVVSFPDVKGVPSVVERANILPPESRMGTITDEEREQVILNSPLREKYAEAVDNFSAYEFLMRRGAEEAAEAYQAEEEGQEEQEAQFDEYGNYTFAGSKYADKVKRPKGSPEPKQSTSGKTSSGSKTSGRRTQSAAEKAAKATGKSMAGTLGREVGQAAGSVLGKTGKRIGGNFGAALGRGLFSTLFSK
ncbi:MAG: DUF853 family protein, partial [Lachnospiraceae bacterium]|nr:DUF853 family protein [Lachnospiraceae bacterium]